MNDRFHIYQMRHLFKGDDPIGKYDVPSHTLRLNDIFGELRQEAKAWFMRTHGIIINVLVGDEEVKAAAPLQEFPVEIRALMTPFEGHNTPAAVDYARKHFTRTEFDRRYQGRHAFETATTPAVAEIPATEPPAEAPAKKKAGRPPKEKPAPANLAELEKEADKDEDED